MSKEVFQLLQELDRNKIDTQLALQCAPLFKGLKISNLLIIQNENYDRVARILEGTSISYIELMLTDEKATFLLYKESEIIAYLSGQKEKALLDKLGYQDVELDRLLLQFQTRYVKYINTGNDFHTKWVYYLDIP